MHVLSVNVGQAETLRLGSKTVRTGLFKKPVDGAVRVTQLGLEGDVQVNKRHHGGADQAVYLYSAEDYAWWEQELERPLEPGVFGENLTLSDFGGEPVRVGDRFRVGEAMLEATAPRIPCANLAGRMGDANFVRRFQEAERPGFYARVVEPGTVQSGDRVERLPADVEALTVLDLARLFFNSQAPQAELRRALAAPLAERCREDFERRLLQ